MFQIALALHRELDPARFETYFFDAGVVYVYLTRSTDAFEGISNLVHELGHTLLAETPLCWR